MTEIDYWPSRQVPRSPEFFLNLAAKQFWVSGDQVHITNIDYQTDADGTRISADLDFNTNPKITPPEWKRFYKVPIARTK